tara:strand:- start:40538 stop:41263 length:726 start_codon:yes stop_codon:yes gene_type:complete
MSTSINRLQERTQDGSVLIGEIVPAAFTLATMLRHRKMAVWLREEFDGYTAIELLPRYRCHQPGHVEVNSPAYGWARVPIDESTIAGLGYLDLYDSVQVLEQVFLNGKKGGGYRNVLSKDAEAVLQQELSVNTVKAFNQGRADDGWKHELVGAELAFYRNRDVYSRVLRTVRATIYLWCDALMEIGIGGDHNSYSTAERQAVEHLNAPETFWISAMETVDDLPVPDPRRVKLLGRLFGSGG